jgi:C4-dicarboxylate transporter/malic acid transport protein
LKSFGPNWFTVTMGTGILAIVFYQLANTAPQVEVLARAFWLANIALFAIISASFVARLVVFPGAFGRIMSHSVDSMFLGAIPMGLATIVNGFATMGPAVFGNTALSVAQVLWWIDAVLAVACGVAVPVAMTTVQEHSLEKMSPLWLLPIVPAEVSAASAGLLAQHLPAASQHVFLTLGVVLWAFSVPAALGLLAVLFMRFVLSGMPPRELGVSGWLALGPLGTGALGAVLLGNAANGAMVGTALAPLSTAFQGCGLVCGLALWSYGVWWWILAIAGTLGHLRKELPFNLGWWGFTFPLGVFTAGTYAIANTIESTSFRIIAFVLTALLATLWAMVAWKTAQAGMSGQLFATPKRTEALQDAA